MTGSGAKSQQETPCPQAILDLVERFADHRDTYTQSEYNETQVRREFIDPFFKALGWDIDNEQGHAEHYKDVIHEDAIKIGETTRAPDYCFRIGGTRKFFVEAKKPSVAVKDDPDPAYQLRRYAWTAKLSLSIVTDFEEFAVYDSRFKPSPNDKPSKGRVLYITFDEYPKRWCEIASIFAKDAILKGSFDKYAESNKRKRGTAQVDDEFLGEIEKWRDLLARNIALRNPTLTVRELNFAVAKTIDRIIFLRMCEDRGIEPYKQLGLLANGSGVYKRLVQRFRRADERYNSGLFHFEIEKDRPEVPDTLTPNLNIDDKILKDILTHLYYPDCPYEFSVLPAEILGQVYEQFLGKVIRLTKGHRAVVEEKPEVKKAGGVYYTPSYIVDYIVAHTVAKLLEGKTPADVGPMLQQRKPSRARKEATPKTSAPQQEKLRILDPACGSGSFLLGAYQYLLNWHIEWYISNDPAKWAKKKTPPIYRITRSKKGGKDWRLTVAERKRILLNNIYGVDIDAQAVEVTKLSLLLKVLENESAESLDNVLKLFHERALPDLAGNIKCGNSLIGPDFYDNQQQTFLDEEEQYRINAFDWQAEFPEVFQSRERQLAEIPRRVRLPSRAREEADLANQGATGGLPASASQYSTGFDAVIGNPPYVRIQNMKQYAPLEVEHYKKRYKAATKGNYDIYVVFVERGLSLLNGTGLLGFILPHKFFNAKYGEPLRKIIAQGKHLSHVVHFGDQQVFAGATTYTCLMFLSGNAIEHLRLVRVCDIQSWLGADQQEEGLVRASDVTEREWSFQIGAGTELFKRLADMNLKLGDIADIFVGLQTSADPVFLFKDTRIPKASTMVVKSKVLDTDVTIETSLLRPVIRSGSIGRYWAKPTAAVLFPYILSASGATLIPEPELLSDAPNGARYLQDNKVLLSSRERGKFRGADWYQLYPKNLDQWEQPKIMLPYMTKRLAAFLDLEGAYFVNVTTGGFGITLKRKLFDLPFLVGLLNSRVLDWFFRRVSTTFHGGYFAANKQFLIQLPIPKLESSEARSTRHDRMVELVQRMLDLHKKLDTARTPVDKTAIQRQIDATDNAIDQLVYQLYELTDDEIKIVEEATTK